MKTTLKLTIALFIGTLLMGACQQAEEPVMEQDQTVAPVTRAFGDKTPIVAIYVETNDINPLNAGDYLLSDGTTYADIVEFFASNIHKRTVDGVVEPTLYLNDKLTRLLEPDPSAPTTTGYHKYVKPLQEKGIKVLLTVLGDWQGIGVANMNDTQTTQFAKILAQVVYNYNLDGIGFDDEYSDYPSGSFVNGSFGDIISKLHNLMPDKMITVFQYNNVGSSQITSSDGALIDYVYSNFATYNTYIQVAGVTKEHYAPLSINLGNYYSPGSITNYGDYAYDVAANGYGAIMHFNLRTLNERPLTESLFDAIASGAWNETVSVSSTPDNAANRPQDWAFISTGFEITMDDVVNF